jgi:putative tricarboxylic transport membrane protein
MTCKSIVAPWWGYLSSYEVTAQVNQVKILQIHGSKMKSERRNKMKSIGYKKMFVLLIMSCLVFSAFTAMAEDKYPSRNIEFVVGWGAGGGTDIFSRIINIPVRGMLKNNIPVINMPGAASALSMEYVQKQPADGYTILGLSSELVSNHLQGLSKYTPRNFSPIMRAHVDIGMIQTAPKSPFKTWTEFIKFAKTGGRKIRLGGMGDDIVRVVIIMDAAGITDKVTFVPFESAGEMHAALLGGHLDAIHEEPGVVLDLIQVGKMIPLIVYTKERLKTFPDVPSAGELGYPIPPGMWRGIVAKEGTPQNIVDILGAAYKKAMDSDMYKAFEKSRLLDLFPGYLGPKDFAADLDREYEVYKKAMQQVAKWNSY